MDQAKESPIPQIETNKTQPENTGKFNLPEKVKGLVGFLNKKTSMENPDSTLKSLAGESIPADNSENQQNLEKANNTLAGLKKAGEMLKLVKENDVAQGVLAAALGLLASYIGVSSEIINAGQIGALNLVGEGSLVDKGKNMAKGAIGVVGGEAFGDLADVAQAVIEKGLRSEISGKAINYARDRMMRRVHRGK